MLGAGVSDSAAVAAAAQTANLKVKHGLWYQLGASAADPGGYGELTAVEIKATDANGMMTGAAIPAPTTTSSTLRRAA